VIVSRAAFLRLAGLACVGVRVEPVAASSDVRLDEAEASHFQRHVGDAFTVFPEDGSAPLRMTLKKVVEEPLTHNVAQFSLAFHDAPGADLVDGIHEFHHHALGSFSIFISSIGAMEGVRAWQACFSRHVKAVTHE
jgi:hypothetical protein